VIQEKRTDGTRKTDVNPLHLTRCRRRRGRRGLPTSQLLQRIQQRPTHRPGAARIRRTCTRSSTGTGTRSSTSLTSASLASTRTSTSLPSTSTSRLRQKNGPLADHVLDAERELVLVGLELELALAKDEGLGLGAEAGDLAFGDVEGAFLKGRSLLV